MTTVRARPERRDPLGDINPYAPSHAGDAAVAFDEVGVGVWRDGEQIVMHEHAPLPDFCLRCGKPASHSKPRVLYWPLTRFEGELRYLRRQGPWLWFRGSWLKFSTDFLDRLPDWPNVK